MRSFPEIKPVLFCNSKEFACIVPQDQQTEAGRRSSDEERTTFSAISAVQDPIHSLLLRCGGKRHLASAVNAQKLHFVLSHRNLVPVIFISVFLSWLFLPSMITKGSRNLLKSSDRYRKQWLTQVYNIGLYESEVLITALSLLRLWCHIQNSQWDHSYLLKEKPNPNFPPWLWSQTLTGL